MILTMRTPSSVLFVSSFFFPSFFFVIFSFFLAGDFAMACRGYHLFFLWFYLSFVGHVSSTRSSLSNKDSRFFFVYPHPFFCPQLMKSRLFFPHSKSTFSFERRSGKSFSPFSLFKRSSKLCCFDPSCTLFASKIL